APAERSRSQPDQSKDGDQVGRKEKDLYELGGDEGHQAPTFGPGRGSLRTAMTEKHRTARWHPAIRLLHWLMVAALAWQAVVALGPMKGAGVIAMTWLPTHISIGVTVFCILVLRLVVRAVTKAPIRQAHWLVRSAGASVHACLYGLIVSIVITGWLAYRPMPLMPPARLFGFLPIPRAPNVAGLTARDFIAIHDTLFWILATLVGLHILAALIHSVLFRDGVMKGMLFGR
ncbi:cytochrome b/b6 domain-containing protein, partial [Mesorhizobium sp. VK24D]